MKNLLIFAAGALAGMFILTLTTMPSLNLGSHTIETSQDSIAKDTAKNITNNINKDISLFENPGKCISTKQFKVLKVSDSGNAIAIEQEHIVNNYYSDTDLKVIFLDNGDQHFYDNQIIKATSGKCFKQIGIYKYTNQFREKETLPIVDIFSR